MELILSAIEVRILGCLIEKQATTPDVYPLTLNALLTACNQKSNREPVMELAEIEVQEALDSLSREMLISSRSASDSRVIKYSHRMRDRRTPEFDFEQAELAVVAVLLLRGPQTLGEIRTRSSRIYQFDDMQALSASLKKLAERSDGPYVKQLPRHPGQKEARYMHLFAGEVEDTPQAVSTVNTSKAQTVELEQRLSQLEEKFSTLQAEFQSFVKQFE